MQQGFQVVQNAPGPVINVANVWLSSLQHRCMQGKDSPGRTVDNDRRIKKKLDMMIKDRLPKQPNGKKSSPPGVWDINTLKHFCLQ